MVLHERSIFYAYITVSVLGVDEFVEKASLALIKSSYKSVSNMKI